MQPWCGGVARDAAARMLRHFGKINSGENQFLQSLNDYIHNPSVTGFFIEQAVLSSIANNGLQLNDINKPMNTVMFSDYPPYGKQENKNDTILYCPLAFNFGAIDGIIVRYDISTTKNGKHKCFLYALQITVAEFHSNSEIKFFNKWSDWTRGLAGFDIEVTFVWITQKPSSVNIKQRIGSGPYYTRRNISLKSVNKDIWERYQNALSQKGNRQGSSTQDLATSSSTESPNLATDNAAESSTQRITRNKLRSWGEKILKF